MRPETHLYVVIPQYLAHKIGSQKESSKMCGKSGRTPGEGNGNPLQYSCLENPMDRGTSWATVMGSQRVGHDWVTDTLTFQTNSNSLKKSLQQSAQEQCPFQLLHIEKISLVPYTYNISCSKNWGKTPYCCCSVAKSRLTLCNPMDCSTPGFPVLCFLPEFAQVHVHWVNDAIQSSHPLSLPSPLALNLSQHQGLF